MCQPRFRLEKIINDSLLLTGGVLFALLLCEGIVRLVGYKPWSVLLPHFDGIPPVTQQNPEVGWVNKPGNYSFRIGASLPVVNVHINSDGSRSAEKTSPLPEGKRIWVMGCSFTYGWGVGDTETFSSVLEEEINKNTQQYTSIVNYGVIGYGTLQSMQLFQLMMRAGMKAPNTVIYGFFDGPGGHTERNLGTPVWLRTISQVASKQAWVTTPYARLRSTKQQDIEIFPPTLYRLWVGAKYSALINLLQEQSEQIKTQSLLKTGGAVTVELIEQYAKLVRDYGGEFYVAVLHLPPGQDQILIALQAAGILLIDLNNITRLPEEGTVIPGDGHPNAEVHHAWGVALAKYLRSSQ